MQKSVLVIGSGIAGISASLKLKTYGINSIIIDKGRFIGGRISSREIKETNDTNYFFHGAQFFTAKSKSFKKIIEQGIKNNFIKEFGNFHPPRFRGHKTMREFLTNLVWEANTNKVSLLNVGQLHSTYNPTDVGRWTLCFVPSSSALRGGTYLTFEEALEVYADYITGDDNGN